MSLLLRWSALRPYTTSYRAFQLSGNPLNPGQVRNASLSAIHRGLRRSERAGSRNDRASRPESRRPLNESRGRSRNRTADEPPSDAFASRFAGAMGGPQRREGHFKPKKAAQKLQEQEEEGGRKSRSKRFNDPEFSFGKKSLVYQLNRGEMKDKVAKLLDKEGPRDEDTSNRFATRQNSSAWRENFGRKGPRDEGNSGFRAERFSPRTGRSDPHSHHAMSLRVRQELEEDDPAPQKRGFRQSGHSPTANRSTDFPVSIQYTTAASQFLFGRSAVSAALKNSQRKIYHLYVQEREQTRRLDENEGVVSLALRKKVEVTHVKARDQKLLDKMSKGRPHNGVVLEASPLPQLPLTALGAVSSSPHGYGVEVAHQSKEEAEINGLTGFIPCRPESARPLVLLLHELLDPGNLGAILRTARFLGVSAVGITNRTSSTITSTVLKAAAGAAEELMLFSVNDPKQFLEASQRAGWTSYAAVAPAPQYHNYKRQWTPDTIEDSNPLTREPCILVLGNEGEGLPRDIRRTASHEVTIPQSESASNIRFMSSVDSLNVSVAAALLCHSFLRGTKPKQSLTLTERLQIDGAKADGGEALF